MKLFLIGFFFVFPASAFFQADQLSIEAEVQFFSELEALIPESLKETVAHRPLVVRGLKSHFQPIDFENCYSSSHDLKNLFHLKDYIWLGSHLKPQKILISPYLHDLILKGYKGTDLSCRHKTQYEYALSVFIHLTALLKDERASLSQCQVKGRRRKKCPKLRVISNSVQFRLLNFQNEYNFSETLDLRQWDRNFSPFAVNLEYFILNEDYACNRPAMARYLSKILEFNLERKCILDSHFKIQNTGRLVDIDPLKLESVKIILTGPGDDFISRWGHLMLQLNYGKSKYIFSYYADKDADITILSGLNGSMKVKPQLYSFQERMNRYKREKVKIGLFTLKFKKEELLNLGEIILEALKFERGTWNHISNNCATNILELIKSASKDKSLLNVVFFSPKSPKSLTQFLYEKGILEVANQ